MAILAQFKLNTNIQFPWELMETTQANALVVQKAVQAIADVAVAYGIKGQFTPTSLNTSTSLAYLNRSAYLYVNLIFKSMSDYCNATANVINKNKLFVEQVNYAILPRIKLVAPQSLLLNQAYFDQINTNWQIVSDRLNAVIGALINCGFSTYIPQQTPINYTPSALNAKLLKDMTTKVQAEQSAGSFSFGYITDVHYSTADPFGTGSMAPDVTGLGIDHLNNIAYLSHDVNLAFIEHNGDLYDGDNKLINGLTDIKKAASTLAQNAACPVLFTKGNHDDNGPYALNVAKAVPISWQVYIDDLVLPDNMATSMFNYNDSGVKYDGQDSTQSYYAYDVPGKSVRVFVLNDFQNDYPSDNGILSTDYLSYWFSTIQQRQLEWFRDSLSQLPDDCYALVFMHNPITPSFNGWEMANGTQLLAILESFQNSSTAKIAPEKINRKSLLTSDFSINYSGHQKGRLIAVFNGHTHYDGAVSVNNVQYVQTVCSLAKNDGKVASGRAVGTVYEDAWDIVTVDLAQRELRLTRYGAGSDRTLSF